MVVGVCTLHLDIADNHSLKGKRSALSPVMARVRDRFNVSIAEVDALEAWQRAVLGIAAVSNDAEYVNGLLNKVVQFIENGRFDVTVADYEIEIL
jgi:uncharacterized protein YlxP (DUF503 family)